MRRRRLQALALVLGLLTAPAAVVPAHDATTCCPPERVETPCHEDSGPGLSRSSMTCCSPAPGFPARAGTLTEPPTVQAPAPAFEAPPLLEPVATPLARRAAELSARASPLLRSVVLRI